MEKELLVLYYDLFSIKINIYKVAMYWVQLLLRKCNLMILDGFVQGRSTLDMYKNNLNYRKTDRI